MTDPAPARVPLVGCGCKACHAAGQRIRIPRVLSGAPGPVLVVVRAPVGRKASVLVGDSVVDGFVWSGDSGDRPTNYTQFAGPEVRSRCVNPDGSVWEDADGRVLGEPQEGWRREVRFVTHVPKVSKVSR